MAQALETVLSGLDTSASRAFREEQRVWRDEDLAWRTKVVQHSSDQAAQRELFRQWRAYNVEQQLLENCRALWERHVAKNQRDVEDAVEQLKCVAQLAALAAGFAVSAFYDFQYTASSDSPVLPFFGAATALTVGLELNSCVMCSLMMSTVVKIGKSYVSVEEEAEYLWRLRFWAATHMPGAVPPAPRRDFRRHWETRCEGRWRLALALFLAGIPFFFALMGLAGYLKFYQSPATTIVTAVLMAAAFVYTVAQCSDWAKALMSGGAANRLPLDSQVATSWFGPSVSARSSPFVYHQVPDKDIAWPPVDPTIQPYGLTVEDLPYPTILGLRPWPGGSVAAGVRGQAFGWEEGVNVDGVGSGGERRAAKGRRVGSLRGGVAELTVELASGESRLAGSAL